jgi:hypothetical protein
MPPPIFHNVRGQHGAGGAQALNWDKLLDGVRPPGLLMMACAPVDMQYYGWRVADALKERNAYRVVAPKYFKCTNLAVHRDGRVVDYSALDVSGQGSYKIEYNNYNLS